MRSKVFMSFGVPSCAKARAQLIFTALLTLCALAANAHAEDVLAIPSRCGSQAELDEQVRALSSDRAQPRTAVRLWQEGDSYRLEVQLPTGTRSLRDSDCRSLFHAAVVIAALGEAAPQVAQPPAAGTGTLHLSVHLENASLSYSF